MSLSLRFSWSLLAVTLVAAGVACGSPVDEDASSVEESVRRRHSRDAGTVDSGTTTDSGTGTDAGATDSGGGSVDGGSAPPGLGCARSPHTCGYADETNTGVPAGTTLSAYTGPFVISTPGTVIDGKDIRGCLTVHAPGVVIRRSKVTCTDGYYGIDSSGYTGTPLLIEDVEVDCAGSHPTGVGEANLVARRLHIHGGCENGFDVDYDVTVEDSYIHDLSLEATAHSDGLQLTPVSARVNIRHNTIFVWEGTSALISAPSGTHDIAVTNNLWAGGAYTLYCPRDNAVNFTVTGNRFSRLLYPKGGAYGPWTDCDVAATVSGNIWDEDGAALTF